MTVLAFPAPELTPEDEAAIVAGLQGARHYACRRELDERGRTALALVDLAGRPRGRVSKRHGVFLVTDARGHVVLRTRRRDELVRLLRG